MGHFLVYCKLQIYNISPHGVILVFKFASVVDLLRVFLILSDQAKNWVSGLLFEHDVMASFSTLLVTPFIPRSPF